MGLGLPDGGHLTHGYYVSLGFGASSHVKWLNVFEFTDRKEEDDSFFHILPVLPVWYPRRIKFDQLRLFGLSSPSLQTKINHLWRLRIPERLGLRPTPSNCR